MLRSRHPNMVGGQLQEIFEINELPEAGFAVFSVGPWQPGEEITMRVGL